MGSCFENVSVDGVVQRLGEVEAVARDVHGELESVDPFDAVTGTKVAVQKAVRVQRAGRSDAEAAVSANQNVCGQVDQHLRRKTRY